MSTARYTTTEWDTPVFDMDDRVSVETMPSTGEKSVDQEIVKLWHG